MKKCTIVILLILIPTALSAQVLILYGGEDHNTFLGYLNVNKYDLDSIWNKYGTYGSKYSSDSIWNKYGTFGSKYNSYSPWNKYTTEPPIIVDAEGNFYGYMTANKNHRQKITIKWILWIIDNYEWIQDDTYKAYDILFQ